LPITAVFRCVRFLTAPLRALSPTGLFFAITFSVATPLRGGLGFERNRRFRAGTNLMARA
jgi:hypothetical protein